MKGRYFLQIPQSLFAINKEIIQGEKQNEYPKNELAHTAVCRLKNIEEITTPPLDTLENGVLGKNSPRHPFQKRNVVNGRKHLRNHLIHCFFMAECLVQTTRFLGNERDDEKHRCDDDEDNEVMSEFPPAEITGGDGKEEDEEVFDEQQKEEDSTAEPIKNKGGRPKGVKNKKKKKNKKKSPPAVKNISNPSDSETE